MTFRNLLTFGTLRVSGLLLWIQASAALAQAEEDGRATAFRAVEGASTEEVQGGTLMIVAYMVALVLLVGYVAHVGGRQRRTSIEIERLGEELSRRTSQK